jgi:hypothetical protein
LTLFWLLLFVCVFEVRLAGHGLMTSSKDRPGDDKGRLDLALR